MTSFKEFVTLWDSYPKVVRESTEKLLYVVAYPDKLEWNDTVEKLCQMTTLLMSGGATGAGTGHNLVHCLQSEVETTLKDNPGCTHAMIVSVGMMFDMTAPITQIQRFIEFSESDIYCKAHILNLLDNESYCHSQHVEINLDKWKTYNCPPIYKLFNTVSRSEENFHDDYTPYWAESSVFRIENFSHEERKYKGYAYPLVKSHMDNLTPVWEAIKSGDTDWYSKVSDRDNYFRHLYARSSQCYYVVNNEFTFMNKIKEFGLTFDLIFTPAAGYIGEMFANELDFDGELIFYDYCHQNVAIKQTTFEMNMPIKDIEKYQEYSNHPFDFTGGNLAPNKAKDYRDEETLLSYQREITDVSYRVMNLINIDLDKLIKDVTGKTVLFNTSNIFGYHMVHAAFTLQEIHNAYNSLRLTLDTYANKCVFRGTNPVKKMVIG